jgi:hypothetical protein
MFESGVLRRNIWSQVRKKKKREGRRGRREEERKLRRLA